MQNNKNTLLTIGQFAALHEINKKTLMWYDEINLFKPAAIKENGYRYYSYYQSSTLETILMLRELNVSIKEIQAFMENRTTSNLEILLKEKITELDYHILHLKAIRKTLLNHKNDISALLSTDLQEISIIEKPPHYLAIAKITKEMSFEQEVEIVIREVKKYQLHRLHNASYGSMISVENLNCGNFEDYYALYIDVLNSTAKKGPHLQPGGRYLRAYCKGSWDKIPTRYAEILDYAKIHGLVLYGYAYETGINEITAQSFEEYITKIEIPLKTMKE